MNETRYLISDASKKLDVEAHVLRYWEEELELDIPRNDLGHRYYTEEHIRMFQRVKELKDNGYQLKAIKMICHKLTNIDDEEFAFLSVLSEEMNRRAVENEEEKMEDLQGPPANIISLNRETTSLTTEEKMEQFQLLMNDIITRALTEGSQAWGESLGNSISDTLSDRLVKELDTLMKLREEQEELRFKLLDETIRNHQKTGVEAAATIAPKQKKKFFQKKKKA